MSKRNRNRAVQATQKGVINNPQGHVEPIKQNVKKPISQLQMTETFSGPIPHPALLSQYGQIIPNGADRIMSMAEKQMEYRISMGNKMLDSDIRRADRGLIFGFVVAIVIIIGGFGLIIAGFQALGISAVIAPLISLVGIFVYTQERRKDQEEKAPPKKNTKSKK